MNSSQITPDILNNYSLYLEKMESYNLYEDSPFLPIKQLSSRTKGAVFESIVEEYARNRGVAVSNPEKSSEYDRVMDGLKVEIKGSFLWGKSSSPSFKWQQIRTGQDYDYIIFIAVYPDVIKIYASYADDVESFVTATDDEGNFPYNQHGGKFHNSGTFFLSGSPLEYDFMIPIDEFWGIR